MVREKQPPSMTISAWAPLKRNVFLVLWCAGLISNIGTWVFNVTSGWLMTELSPSPLMVSLVQAATAMPIFLFALPAGALGDIFDRRKLLMVVLTILALILFIFAALIKRNILNAWLLLLFTFLVGAGTAFFTPTWQAIMPYLVPKKELHSAIALNGISMNFARAVGPAIGGLLLAAFGAILAVIIDAVSYLFVVVGLLWWRMALVESVLPRERVFGAMRAGLRFVILSEALIATLVRAFIFVLFASAFWALLPLIAKDLLAGGPKLYGLLLSGIGAGAITGALLLPLIRKKLNAHGMVMTGTLFTVSALLLFALGGHWFTGIAASILAGISWIIALSTLNVSAQYALPDWVRARGLAIFQVVFFGGMMLGSVLWGQLAQVIGLKFALMVSAGLALLSLPLTKIWQLNLGEDNDFSPSRHWPDPSQQREIEPYQGPVLIMIEYQIAIDNRSLFEERIHKLGVIRKRDGATFWGVFEDVANPGHYIETFVDESWVAHLRKHERVSASDREVQDKLLSLHIGAQPPKVTHALAPKKTRKKRKSR